MKKNWTGERLETFIYSQDTIDHLHRYAIASSYCIDKLVLDIASGEGYGSNLLAEKSKFVYGVDIDEPTIEKANQKYKKPNLNFKYGSTSAIPLENDSIDVVVSFETIEHHDEHEKMMLEIKRVLKNDGILIVSTPDKKYYSDERNFENKFHIKELYKNEFIDLISHYFSEVQMLTQQYIGGNSYINIEDEYKDFKIYSGDYKSINEKNINPLYLLAIASNETFLKQKASVFEGYKVIENQIYTTFSKSNSFKIGNFILKPIKTIKKIFK